MAPYVYTVSIVAISYWLSLVVVFPHYFTPWIPVHRDIFDYYSAGDLTWQQAFDSPRPLAWLLMKLVSAFGLYAESEFLIVLTLLGIVFLSLAIRELLGLSWRSFLISLPIYAIGLFSNPQFYVMHRDDFGLAVSFFMITLSLLTCTRWVKTNSKFLLVVTLVNMAFFPFAKETFWIAGPTLFALIALTGRNRWRFGIFAIESSIFVAFAYLLLHARSPFLNASAGQYSVSLHVSSFLPVLEQYVNLGLAIPALLLCLLAAWNMRGMPRSLLMLAAPFAAGIAAYLPNSFLPNHLLNWYGWVGVPFMLAPLLASVNIDPLEAA